MQHESPPKDPPFFPSPINAPTGGPTVLNDVVIKPRIVIIAVSHRQHCMVHILGTILADLTIIDSAIIEPEVACHLIRPDKYST